LLLDPPGTAIHAGYTALYRSAFDLAQDMAEAEATRHPQEPGG
jgi:hypothetical protein